MFVEKQTKRGHKKKGLERERERCPLFAVKKEQLPLMLCCGD
jgi:hypothetical protein